MARKKGLNGTMGKEGVKNRLEAEGVRRYGKRRQMWKKQGGGRQSG